MRTARKITRGCAVCGDGIKINVDAKGHYDNGHYFGIMKVLVKGTGTYVKVGTTDIFSKPADVVKWTGKEKAAEYWECNLCYGQAQREGWLENAIEKYYGERCPDFEASCIVCDVWSLYNKIVKDDRLRGNFRQTYDKRANAAYIYVKDRTKPGESMRTLELSDFVNLDFDKNRTLLGIEILSASKNLPKVFKA